MKKSIEKIKTWSEWCQQVDDCLKDTYKSYIKIGEAIYNLRDKKKYQQFWKLDSEFIGYLRIKEREKEVFGVYCKWRWGFTPQYARNFVRAYLVYMLLSDKKVETIVSTFPENESVARPLGQMLDAPEALVACWCRVVEKAKGKRITARDVDAEIPDDFRPKIKKAKELQSQYRVETGDLKEDIKIFMEKTIAKVEDLLQEDQLAKDLDLILQERNQWESTERLDKALEELILRIVEYREELAKKVIDVDSEVRK